MHLFVGNGQLATPPLRRGFCSGFLRDRLLAEGKAVEKDLRPEDLGAEFLIGNSLHGLLRAVRQQAESGAADR
jgi:para-aminobenzoate synthetase/4-amino-4-deoxychorismate lyase